jgi:hypothetical protein
VTAPTTHELALLRMLAAGEGFETACLALKDEGVRAAFQCVLKGWIDRGCITEAGRVLATAKGVGNWEITILPSPKTGRA